MLSAWAPSDQKKKQMEVPKAEVPQVTAKSSMGSADLTIPQVMKIGISRGAAILSVESLILSKARSKRNSKRDFSYEYC